MKIACVSLGCPKNQVDLDGMVYTLLAAGHETVADIADADMVLVNTCGFIESAKTEAIENILEACSYKQQNPDLKVVVTGCLAERYRSQIRTEIPEVDAVVGCASNGIIDQIAARVAGGEQLETYGPKRDFPLGGKRVIGTPAHYAYLKIAEGCNNRCHYCAIPLIRGPLRSRDRPHRLRRGLGQAGQHLRPAGPPERHRGDRVDPHLVRLPRADHRRFYRRHAAQQQGPAVSGSAHPALQRRDFAQHEPPLHQSRAAGRHRAAAGCHPEAQFEELCGFVKQVEFDRLGCFAYSAEENTRAAAMEGQLDEETKNRRAEIVMEIQTGIMARKQAEKVGQTLHVLCDGLDDESGLYICRTAADAPEIDGAVCVASDEPLYPGQFYDVNIEESDLYDLYGRVADKTGGTDHESAQ